jgi:hypothetical protein
MFSIFFNIFEILKCNNAVFIFHFIIHDETSSKTVFNDQTQRFWLGLSIGKREKNEKKKEKQMLIVFVICVV